MSCKPCQKKTPDTIGGLVFKHDFNDLLNYMDEVQKASKLLDADVSNFDKIQAGLRTVDPDHQHPGIAGSDWETLKMYLWGVNNPPEWWQWEDAPLPNPALQQGWYRYYPMYSGVTQRLTNTEKIWNETQNYEARLIELYDVFSKYGVVMSQVRPKLGSDDPNAEKTVRDTAANVGDAMATGFKLALFVGGLWLAKEFLGSKKG